jgi:hypothetical protein
VAQFARLTQALHELEAFAGLRQDHDLEPAGLPKAAEQLRDAVVDTFGGPDCHEFVGAACEMAESGETAAAFRFFIEFDAFVEAMEAFEEYRRVVLRRVHTGRLRTFLHGLDKFCASAPDARWHGFAERISASPAAQAEANLLTTRLHTVDLAEIRRLVAPQPPGCENEEDAFADHVLRLAEPLEAVYRFFWLSAQQGEPAGDSPEALLAAAWMEMLPALGDAIDAPAVRRAVASAASIAARCGLDDVADYLLHDARMLEYGLAYFVPPSPSLVRIGSLDDVRELLVGQISSWYLHPFRHRLTPVEMMGVVLNSGRPLYYDRYLGHLLLQRVLLENVMDRCQASDALYWSAAFDRQIAVALDGHLLRARSTPRLKTQDGWIEYLEDLVNLHFPPDARGNGTERIQSCRRDFLRQHGAADTSDLFWTNLSHPKAN